MQASCSLVVRNLDYLASREGGGRLEVAVRPLNDCGHRAYFGGCLKLGVKLPFATGADRSLETQLHFFATSFWSIAWVK